MGGTAVTPPPATVADLVADPANRRQHPARNLAMTRESLETVGAARSIVIDESNVVLAGNGVAAAASAAGLTKLRIIETDGDELVAVRRRGLTDEQKRALALYDNRTAELATWDWTQLAADQAAGLSLAPWWDARELAGLQSVPDATPSAEPTLAAECRIEILCSRADVAAFQAVLDDWGRRPGVEVQIA